QAFAERCTRDAATCEELDRIRNECSRRAENFSAAVIDVEWRGRKQREQLAARVRLEIPDLTQRLDSERKKREQAEAQLEHVRRGLEQERKGLEQVRMELERERKHLEQARKDLDGLAAAKQELERVRGALREANSSLAQANRMKDQLMRERSAHRSEVAAARKQIEVLRLEARMAKEGLDQVLQSNTW